MNGPTPEQYLAGHYWAVSGTNNREILIYVLEVLPWGALIKTLGPMGWKKVVVINDTLAMWEWREVDKSEADAWPEWKLQ